MENTTPNKCSICEIPIIERIGAEKCPYYPGNDSKPCPRYQRIGRDHFKLIEDRTFEKFAEWDERHAERVGDGQPSSTLRDLMARDLVRWLDDYDVRATFHLAGPPEEEQLLLYLLDVEPVCRADRMAAVLMAKALRGDFHAWDEISALLDRLDDAQDDD